MDKKDIADLLNSRRPEPLGMEHRYAVLCLLVEVEGRWHVIFEKRSATLRSHTGEVSLPGGRIEEGETPKDAAIRETAEELRISPSALEILGESDYLLTRQNQAVHCFVGILRGIRPEDIRLVVGTSMGALTGAFVVQENTDVLEDIWQKLFLIHI